MCKRSVPGELFENFFQAFQQHFLQRQLLSCDFWKAVDFLATVGCSRHHDCSVSSVTTTSAALATRAFFKIAETVLKRSNRFAFRIFLHAIA